MSSKYLSLENNVFLTNIQKQTSLVILFGFLWVYLPGTLTGQILVQDSLLVSFENAGDLAPFNFCIDSVVDHREEPARFVGSYETNKYLFIPVDLLIYSQKPLNEEISEALAGFSPANDSPHFKLVINEFELVRNTKSLFYPRYLCQANLAVYQLQPSQNPVPLGSLIYESSAYKPLFGDKLRTGFNKVLHNWQRELQNNLAEITNQLNSNQEPVLENLRPINAHARPVNLLGGGDFIWGTRDWIVDGEIFFSPREAKRSFFRSGYPLRYRRAHHFEAIEFGFSNDYWFYRWHRKWIFRIKSQLMYGFNRWNDFKTTKHKLWDLLIGDYSLSQSLIFNPLDKSALTFGFGLQENVYYVYSQGVKFQIGLLLNLGVKL